MDLLVGQFLYAMLGAALPIVEKLWAFNGGLALAKMKNFLEGVIVPCDEDFSV